MSIKHYSRSITGLLPKPIKFRLKSQFSDTIKHNIHRYLFFYLLGLFTFLFLLASLLFNVYKEENNVRTREEKKLGYWEYVVRQHPNYPDAYYKAAVSAVRLQEKDKARGYLDRALSLDPMFAEAEELRERVK